MRWRHLLLLLLLGPYVAWAQEILNTPISVNLQSESPDVILQAIESAARVPIYFQEVDLPAELYDLQVNNQALGRTLTQWLSPIGLGFEVYQNQAIIVGPIEQLSRSYNREFFLEQYNQAISNIDTLRESAYL
ncbi:MAG: hypothetical protein AAFQ68_29455, partial [Bacteroidota bacterium]